MRCGGTREPSSEGSFDVGVNTDLFTGQRSRNARCWQNLYFIMLWTLLSVASRTAAAKAQLRVVTMNIHAWRDSDHRLNFDRLVAQLQKLRPDVVCLNEVLHPFCAPAPDDPYWEDCLLYTSPSPRDRFLSRMPSSA